MLITQNLFENNLMILSVETWLEQPTTRLLLSQFSVFSKLLHSIFMSNFYIFVIETSLTRVFPKVQSWFILQTTLTICTAWGRCLYITVFTVYWLSRYHQHSLQRRTIKSHIHYSFEYISDSVNLFGANYKNWYNLFTICLQKEEQSSFLSLFTLYLTFYHWFLV